MQMNFLVIALAALIPIAVGFIWYHPKVFGTAWMKAAGLSEEQLKGGNMGIVFGLTYVLSFMAAMSLQFMVIHQWSIYSILADDPGINDPTSEAGMFITSFMEKYGENFRTFKHGAFHGVLSGVMFVLPVIGINALFERRGFKYVAVNAGYWIVALALVGGVLCAFV